MTPFEHARKIDAEEFAAECAAVRQRAYAYVEQRRHETRCEIAHWLGSEIPKFNKRPFRPQPVSEDRTNRRPTRISREFSIDGMTKTLTEWAEHLSITPNALQVRASRLGSYEAAIKLGAGSQRNRPITCNGETLTVKQWAERLGIAPNSLHARIAKHGVQAAIAMGGPLARPANDTDPGVSLDFRPLKETGAWSVLQETPEITFHDKANSA